MHKISGQKLLVCVAGSIAAYKAAEYVRQFRKQGADVRVVMTDAATKFIAPMTFEALISKPVLIDRFATTETGAIAHIDAARWADRVVILPATANTIAKLAYGFADDLTTAICLATRAPIFIAPAMNTLMLEHPATQANIRLLVERGMIQLPPASGDLACGESGVGKLCTWETVCEYLTVYPRERNWAGKSILVTAGPTYEPIDPVRFLGNRSSGKMGVALAKAAFHLGASVTMIHGQMSIAPPACVTAIPVQTADEMFAAVKAEIADHQMFISAAAVADYRPSTYASEKIHKTDSDRQIVLTRNPDILSYVSEHYPDVFTVGFAAETESVVERAHAKREAKGIDLIVANDVSQLGQGFDSDENAVTILSDAGEIFLAKASKEAIAGDIVKKMQNFL